MSDRVAIVAAAQTRFSPKRGDAQYNELGWEVIKEVMESAGLEMEKDIDNSISCSHDVWDGQTISNIGITDVIGGHLRNEEKMAMDGSTAVYYGAIGILSGEHDCTLIMAHTKMSATRRNVVSNNGFEPLYNRLLGLDWTSAAAMQQRRYMEAYGVTAKQVAQVAVKNLSNAQNNRWAHNFGTYTIEDILNSPMVADPITEKMMAPDTDGAVALILASEKKAKSITKNPVWIKGIGTSYDAYFLGDRDLSKVASLRDATSQAYNMAGIKKPSSEIDLVELDEEFAYQELMWMEGLGLCDEGTAGQLLESGETLPGGKLPVNPSGGVLSGVPHNVMGLNCVAQAARQIMGTAGGHQVKDVNLAVAQGHSGFCGQHHCVIVLGRE